VAAKTIEKRAGRAGDRTRSLRRRLVAHRNIVVGAIIVILAAAVAFDPTGFIVIAAGSVGSLIALCAGVWIYRPARIGPWLLAIAALVLFLADGVTRDLYSTLGTNLTWQRTLVPDFLALPGQVLLGSALIGFDRARHDSRSNQRVIIYDGVLAALAILAISWVYVIEPIVSRHHTPIAVRVILAAYPAISLFLFVLMVQIAYGAGRVRGAADRYLIAALLAMFVGDAIYMLAEIHVIADSRLIELPYVIAFGSAAAGALDPSMRLLTERGSLPGTRWTKGRFSLVVVALLIPPVLLLAAHNESISERAVLFGIVLLMAVTAILEIVQALRAMEQSESRLTHQALHDDLTTLPNRRSLNGHITRALAKLEDPDSMIAVILLDIDRFKLINDTLGHGHGDELLVQIARRLRMFTHGVDFVARIGGDEFVVVPEKPLDDAEARAFANDLRACLNEPFVVAHTELHVTASVGVACSAAGGGRAGAEQLIRNADTAMYQAKEAGRDAVALFEDSMRTQLYERVAIERELHHAVERHQLHLVFQPIISFEESDVLGVEALVRWAHPTLGVIPPLRFISIAEETDLIGEIGLFVLEEAMRNLAAWRAIPGYEKLTVSVNLSVVQLRDELLVQRVSRVLQQNKLPGSSLTLEITETEMMRDPELSITALNELRRLGVRISVDDFGTEYSSLAYLQRLPIDELKIDRSFVVGMGNGDSASQTLVAAIVAMANALSIRTVIEGIETSEQAMKVVDLGCHGAQGFLYARPARADQVIDIVGLLKRWLPGALEAEKSGEELHPPLLEVVPSRAT
jgi:diguanylate cyclase